MDEKRWFSLQPRNRGDLSFFFFFNDTATTEIYTLSLHDALPICRSTAPHLSSPCHAARARAGESPCADRKSTRLNSSHSQISYAVFCLKKKKNTVLHTNRIFQPVKSRDHCAMLLLTVLLMLTLAT